MKKPSAARIAMGALCLCAWMALPVYAAQPSKTPAPTASPRPLVRGARGKEVKAMQRRLSELGFNVSSSNAIFAEKTVLELLKFQRINGLAETGELDAETIAVLYGDAALSATPTPPPLSAEEPMPRTASALVKFATSRVGAGYVYGSVGDLCSPWFRKQGAELYPKYKDALLHIADQWDGREVYDCVGLLKAFLSHSEGDFPREWNTNVTGATKKWLTEMGTINTMPREPGILLFQLDPEDNSYMHMGVYTGGGRCVHARGHAYGVVEDPMPQLWTHWGRASWLTYDLPAEKAVPWKPYLAAGSVALVDSSYGGDLPIRAQPRSDGAFTGARLTNLTQITIDSVPNDPAAWYWRVVTGTDRKGNTVTGYVYAKDLTVAEALPERTPLPPPAPSPTPKPKKK